MVVNQHYGNEVRETLGEWARQKNSRLIKDIKSEVEMREDGLKGRREKSGLA